MPQKDQLTTEYLKKNFKNNFDLTNYAIELGKYFVKSGHEASLEQLLDQIRRNPSEKYLKDLQMIDEEDENEE